MSKTLIVIGLVAIVAGLLWPWLSKLPFGHLPGDIVIKRDDFSFFFPITTMILLSGAISLLLWLLNR